MMESLFPTEGSRIRFAFDCMEVAEQYADPPRAKKTRLPFSALAPSPVLSEIKSLDLYRAHLEELKERAAEGRDLRPATDAELAASWSLTSLQAPLNLLASQAYQDVFRRAWARSGRPLPAALTLTEGCEPAAQELNDAARRRLAMEERRL